MRKLVELGEKIRCKHGEKKIHDPSYYLDRLVGILFREISQSFLLYRSGKYKLEDMASLIRRDLANYIFLDPSNILNLFVFEYESLSKAIDWLYPTNKQKRMLRTRLEKAYKDMSGL